MPTLRAWFLMQNRPARFGLEQACSVSTSASQSIKHAEAAAREV